MFKISVVSEKFKRNFAKNYLENFLDEENWQKKIETFTNEKQNYWHVMDLKMWFYFYKQHLAVPFRNDYYRKNIF